MTATRTTAVEQAADTLGEMLMEMTNEAAEYTYEDIAAATLETGLRTLLGEELNAERVEQAAEMLYQKLHDADKPKWDTLNAIERDFWLEIAQASIRASDAWLLQQVGERNQLATDG